MFSTKGRYAVRALIDMAEHSGEGCVRLKDIAQRQQISKKYLEIIVRDLVVAGLVIGISGRNGGYRLGRAPSEITIGEILEQTEGPLSCVACLAGGNDDCPRKAECKTLPMWREYNRITRAFFYKKKLSDFLKKRSR